MAPLHLAQGGRCTEVPHVLVTNMNYPFSSSCRFGGAKLQRSTAVSSLRRRGVPPRLVTFPYEWVFPCIPHPSSFQPWLQNNLNTVFAVRYVLFNHFMVARRKVPCMHGEQYQASTRYALIRAPGPVVQGEEKRRVPQLRLVGRRSAYTALANKRRTSKGATGGNFRPGLMWRRKTSIGVCFRVAGGHNQPIT